MKSIPLGRSLGEAVQESGPRSHPSLSAMYSERSALDIAKVCFCFCSNVFAERSANTPFSWSSPSWACVAHIAKHVQISSQSHLEFQDWMTEILSEILDQFQHWLTQLSWHLLFVFKVVLQFEGKNHLNKKYYFPQLLCCIILNNLETRKKNGWKISFLHKFCSFSTFTIFWVIFPHRMFVPNDRSLFLFVPTKIGPKTLWTISCSS